MKYVFNIDFSIVDKSGVTRNQIMKRVVNIITKQDKNFRIDLLSVTSISDVCYSTQWNVDSATCHLHASISIESTLARFSTIPKLIDAFPDFSFKTIEVSTK